MKTAINLQMDYCIICGQMFNNKILKSKEHIIPEALGNDHIVTYCVCENCNNKLGTIVDSYLTNHIAVKMIRQLSLEKDIDLQMFDTVLPDENGIKHRIYNDSAEPMTDIQITKNDDTGLHLHIKTGNYDEAIEQAKKRVKRTYNVSDEEVEKMLTCDGAIMISESEFYRPKFKQLAEIDRAKWIMAAIKIAYEYAVEKIGEPYLHDELANVYRCMLLAAVKGKKKYTDMEYQNLYKYCDIADFQSALNKVAERYNHSIKGLKKQHLSIERMDNNKLYCHIRILDDDLLDFKVLLSENAEKYLASAKMIVTETDDDGRLVNS